jgi:hypothetical protein
MLKPFQLSKKANFSKLLVQRVVCGKIQPYGKSRYQNQNRGRWPALQIQSVGVAFHGSHVIWCGNDVVLFVRQASRTIPNGVQKDIGQIASGVFTILQGA